MNQIRVIAEFGQCSGNAAYLREAIKVAAGAGCWGVKFQLLQPETIARTDAQVYWRETRPGITGQRSSFERTGLLPYNSDMIADLLALAVSHDIQLIASPFDLDAVACMAEAGMSWCKIASGDLTYHRLISGAAEAFPSGMILSTGAATLAEIEQARGWVDYSAGEEPAAILACSLAYPTGTVDAQTRRVQTLRRYFGRFGTDIGYSDHTTSAVAAVTAVAFGATIFEVHATLDADDPDTPDNVFALPPDELARYVFAVKSAQLACGSGALEPTNAEIPARLHARRSLCAARDLPAGHLVTDADLIALRPSSPSRWFRADETDLVVGRVLAVDVKEGAAVSRSAVAALQP